MKVHEFECFQDKLQASGEFELISYCLLAEPRPLEFDDYDVFMVGGSGDYGCVNNTQSWFLRTQELLQAVVEQGRPLFCSCFGHQALASALGGEVITDRDRTELGTFELSLTEQGKADPLFGQLPARFKAQLGHNDHVVKLPRGAELLASSERCEIQAYRLVGKPVYATQFHPELSHHDNIHRAGGYMHVYDADQKCVKRLDQAFQESPEAITLLSRFVNLVKAGQL